MQIGPDTIVSMHYQVATAEGEQVDRSQEGQPLVYLHGHGQILPGLEAALVGHAVGEKVEAQLPPATAYGDYDQDLDIRVSKDAFPADVQSKLEPGFQFMAQHPGKEGENLLYTVHGVENDEVLVSGNHPLAGKTLHFQVEIVEVRTASAEELTHGHAHGAGGHHH
jgi:FKBP-type peptidyl-prolyl cis-trans isomerase SlyD